MEAFAAMMDHADVQFARILRALEDMGERDNTLVLVLSDNGANAEGGLTGTFNEMLLGLVTWEDNLKYYDKWGGPATYPTTRWAGRQRINVVFLRLLVEHFYHLRQLFRLG